MGPERGPEGVLSRRRNTTRLLRQAWLTTVGIRFFSETCGRSSADEAAGTERETCDVSQTITWSSSKIGPKLATFIRDIENGAADTIDARFRLSGQRLVEPTARFTVRRDGPGS